MCVDVYLCVLQRERERERECERERKRQKDKERKRERERKREKEKERERERERERELCRENIVCEIATHPRHREMRILHTNTPSKSCRHGDETER